MNYFYNWRHVPTGKCGCRLIKCSNELEFYRQLDRWNCQARGMWVYWS